MRFLHRIFLLIISTILVSCNRSEEQLEASLLNSFEEYEDNLNSVVKHVVKTYYNRDELIRFNQLRFVLGTKNYQNRGIISDSLVSNELRNTAVVGISFAKESMCLDKYQFDVVRFKLFIKGNAFQYYYVYEFCPRNLEDVDNLNFKSIQLDSNWSLHVEKN